MALDLERRIKSLKEKHARVDQMLHEEEIRLGNDPTVLHKLKTQKLSVKDEIERLLHGQRVAA